MVQRSARIAFQRSGEKESNECVPCRESVDLRLNTVYTNVGIVTVDSEVLA